MSECEETGPVTQSRAHRAVIYVDLAGFRDIRLVRLILLVGLGGIAALFAMTALTGPPLAEDWIGALSLSGLALLVTLVVAAIYLFQLRTAQAAAGRVLTNETALTVESAAAAIIRRMGGLARVHLFRSPAAHVNEFERRMRQLGFGHVTAVVEDALKASIESIEIADAFFEPEHVVSQPRRWSGWMIVAIAVGALYLPMFVIPGIRDGDPLQLAVGVGWLIGMGIPLLRSFGWRIGESRAPVVGLGVVEDNRGRRWTVKDSTMLVRRQETSSYIRVELTGPAGLLAIRFWGTDDAGFRLLWQRWMHPHPRTDLG